MRSESITVSEAVIMAGLPTDGAAMRKARIITPDINGSTAKEVDLYSLLYGGDLKENVSLKPGDYLYVPAAVTESAGDMQDGNNNFDPLVIIPLGLKMSSKSVLCVTRILAVFILLTRRARSSISLWGTLTLSG